MTKRPVITNKRAAVLAWIAHAHLTGEAQCFSCYGNGINPAEVEVTYLKEKLPWLTNDILAGMERADLIDVLYSDDGPVIECSVAKISAVILNESAIRWLVAEMVIPANFAGVFSDIAAAREAVLETGQFKEWLEIYTPPQFVYVDAAPATVTNTSKWVTKLAYTPEEARAEIALIERSSMTKGSKAAFKAHVSRRVVA